MLQRIDYLASMYNWLGVLDDKATFSSFGNPIIIEGKGENVIVSVGSRGRILPRRRSELKVVVFLQSETICIFKYTKRNKQAAR